MDIAALTSDLIRCTCAESVNVVGSELLILTGIKIILSAKEL